MWNHSEIVYKDTTQREVLYDERRERHAFMRKVYSIMTVQMSLVVCCTSLFVCLSSASSWMQCYPFMFWTFLSLFLVTSLLLAFFEERRRAFPFNWVCLVLFTLLLGGVLGSAAAQFQVECIVLSMGIVSLNLFILTCFSFQQYLDLTVYKAVLIVIVSTSFCYAVLALSFHDLLIQMSAASSVALLFSWYIVIIMYLFVGSEPRSKLYPAECVTAALNVYLEIFNLIMKCIECLVFFCVGVLRKNG